MILGHLDLVPVTDCLVDLLLLCCNLLGCKLLFVALFGWCCPSPIQGVRAGTVVIHCGLCLCVVLCGLSALLILLSANLLYGIKPAGNLIIQGLQVPAEVSPG